MRGEGRGYKGEEGRAQGRGPLLLLLLPLRCLLLLLLLLLLPWCSTCCCCYCCCCCMLTSGSVAVAKWLLGCSIHWVLAGGGERQ